MSYETYSAMKARYRDAIDDLPIFFAFNEQQFKEGMESFGLTMEDKDKISMLGKTGGFFKDQDFEVIMDTLQQADEEVDRRLKEDLTGKGFIKEAFKYELEDHEYIVNHDIQPALDALNLTEENLKQNKNLQNGLNLAIKEIRKTTRNM